jgi:hypothetical protein
VTTYGRGMTAQSDRRAHRVPVVGHDPARVVWTVVGPLHRRVAPYLLERAAARGDGSGSPALLSFSAHRRDGGVS